MIYFCISVTVVQDDDLVEEPFEEPSDEPSGTRTPPTPVVSPSPAPAPPPPAPPLRQRAMAQLRPVSVPAVIKDMAGRNLAQTLRDRFWNDRSGISIVDDDAGPCMGIELNIWERAKV